MRCHVCNAEVGEGQRFCHECGESLAGVTDPTQELSALPDLPPPSDGESASVTSATLASADGTGGAAGCDNTTADRAGTGDDPGMRRSTESVAPVGGVDDGSGIDGRGVEGSGVGDGGPPTERVPAVELPTHAVPILSDTSGGTRRPGSTDDDAGSDTHLAADDAAEGDTDAAVPAGPIGSSLFDPETAPPVADVAWNDPIPPLRDEDFGTDVAGVDDATRTPPAGPVPAAESTTTIPLHDPATTGRQAVVYDHDAATSRPLLDGELHAFVLRPAVVFAFLGLLTVVLASLADVVDIRTSRVVAGIPIVTSTLGDIGSNLAIAGLVGAGAMFIGGILQCFHVRWGAGLAGGAGLSLVGWAGMTLGLAEIPIASAQRVTQDPATPGPFTLTVTRDIGYWLLVAVAVIGLVVFAFSLTSIGTGGRRGLNPWTAAVGAVTALVIAAGPLVTVGGANFDVNFGTQGFPAVFFAGRLLQLGLIAVTGVVGFLLVRTWGLGLVAGGLLLPVWLWLSSLLDLGDPPVLGIAVGNLGSAETSPHAVTTVGVAATVVMLAVAAAIAVAQRPRPTA